MGWFVLELARSGHAPCDVVGSTILRPAPLEHVWSFPTECWKHEEAPKSFNRKSKTEQIQDEKPGEICNIPCALSSELVINTSPPDPHRSSEAVHIGPRLASRLRCHEFETAVLKRAMREWADGSLQLLDVSTQECLETLADRCIQTIINGCRASERSQIGTLCSFSIFLGIPRSHNTPPLCSAHSCPNCIPPSFSPSRLQRTAAACHRRRGRRLR